MSQETCKLILNSKEKLLPLPFMKIGEISGDIFTSLSRDNRQYVVQSKVSEEVLEEYILYLTKGKEPEVHIDNNFQYQQLAVEFGTQKISELIQAKISKWRQIEAQLEHQGTLSNSKEQELEEKIQNLEQNLLSLHEILQQQLNQFKNEIEILKEDFRNQNITNLAELEKMETNQKNLLEKISEIQNVFTDNFETTNNEIKNDIENIKQDILNNDEKIQTQVNQVHEHSTSIERLENQMNSLQNELSNAIEQINQNETNSNSEFESIQLTIEEIKSSYIDKDVFIFQ